MSDARSLHARLATCSRTQQYGFLQILPSTRGPARGQVSTREVKRVEHIVGAGGSTRRVHFHEIGGTLDHSWNVPECGANPRGSSTPFICRGHNRRHVLRWHSHLIHVCLNTPYDESSRSYSALPMRLRVQRIWTPIRILAGARKVPEISVEISRLVCNLPGSKKLAAQRTTVVTVPCPLLHGSRET